MTARSGRAARCAATLAGAVAVGLSGCATGSGPDVVVTPVGMGPLTVTPGASASVVGASDTTITVARRGTVTALSVQPGEQVQAGQPVAVVRELGTPTEQQAVASQLEGLQTLLLAQRQADGPYSHQVSLTLSRIAAARQQLAAVTGAPAVLTAPQAGVVATLDVAVGSAVDTSKPLMRIVDASSVRITVGLAGEYRTVVHVGDAGQLVVPGSGGRRLPATVTALVPSSQGDGGFQVTATAANPDGVLAVGATAYLRLDEHVPQALRVPTRAVLGTSAQPYVYLVDSGHASLVPVTVGPSDGTWTQVLSGLRIGQRVVLAGNQDLADEQPVHVSAEEAPS